MGHSVFLISKGLLETTKLLDKKYTKEASYTAQQNF